MKFMHKEVRQLGDPCMSILYPLYERRKARPEVKYDNHSHSEKTIIYAIPRIIQGIHR